MYVWNVKFGLDVDDVSLGLGVDRDEQDSAMDKIIFKSEFLAIAMSVDKSSAANTSTMTISILVLTVFKIIIGRS